MRKIPNHASVRLASLLAVMLIAPSAWDDLPLVRGDKPAPTAAEPTEAEAAKADAPKAEPSKAALAKDGSNPEKAGEATASAAVPAAAVAGVKPATVKPSSVARIGDPAPELRLPGPDGRLTSLSEFHGKVVLVYFWATWCEPCKRAIPVLNDIDGQFDDSEVVVLSINVDPDPAKVAAFAKQNGIGQSVLMRGGSVIRKFGLAEIPSMVVVGRDGTVAKTLRGMPGDGGREVVTAIQSALKK